MSFQSLSWHTLGGQLYAAQLGDQPLFYLSPLTPPAADAQGALRGGVPVLFPQFAHRGYGPKHGFVRQQIWEALPDQNGYSLDVPPQLERHWSGHAQLQITALAQPDELSISLHITNTGEEAFSFTGGLHPYFVVDQLQQTQIVGLDSTPFDDRYHHEEALGHYPWSELPFERLYFQAPELLLNANGRQLQLTTTGFHNWMIWNPGARVARQLRDLPDADWERFVCIEPVIVEPALRLQPQMTFVGTLTIRQLS